METLDYVIENTGAAEVEQQLIRGQTSLESPCRCRRIETRRHPFFIQSEKPTCCVTPMHLGIEINGIKLIQLAGKLGMKLGFETQLDVLSVSFNARLKIKTKLKNSTLLPPSAGILQFVF